MHTFSAWFATLVASSHSSLHLPRYRRPRQAGGALNPGSAGNGFGFKGLDTRHGHCTQCYPQKMCKTLGAARARWFLRVWAWGALALHVFCAEGNSLTKSTAWVAPRVLAHNLIHRNCSEQEWRFQPSCLDFAHSQIVLFIQRVSSSPGLLHTLLSTEGVQNLCPDRPLRALASSTATVSGIIFHMPRFCAA